MKFWFCFACALLVATRAQAIEIGAFPGLEQLIAHADAIVVLRIDRNLEVSRVSPNSTHDCYIYQCLKGTIQPGSRLRLALMEARSNSVSPFSLHSTHLVFLMKKLSPNEPTEYRTMAFQGADLRLSPMGNEKMPEGATVAEKVRSLPRTSIAFWDAQAKKDKDFFDVVLAGQPDKEFR